MDAMHGVAITGAMPREYDGILTPEAISFVAHLARMFTPRVTELLARRNSVQVSFIPRLAAPQSAPGRRSTCSQSTCSWLPSALHLLVALKSLKKR